MVNSGLYYFFEGTEAESVRRDCVRRMNTLFRYLEPPPRYTARLRRVIKVIFKRTQRTSLKSTEFVMPLLLVVFAKI